MFPPFGWQVLNSPQRNLPKYVQSRTLSEKVMSMAFLAHTGLPYSLLWLYRIVCSWDCCFWWSRCKVAKNLLVPFGADVWKSPPVTASFHLLPWRLDDIQCQNQSQGPCYCSCFHSACEHFMFLCDVGRPFFCLHVKLHYFCLCTWSCLLGDSITCPWGLGRRKFDWLESYWKSALWSNTKLYHQAKLLCKELLFPEEKLFPVSPVSQNSSYYTP